jgi:hypothetical protein
VSTGLPQLRNPARTVGHSAGNVALIDLLDRLLQGGIAIRGDIILTAAEIDLVKLDLRIVIAAIDKLTDAL